MKSFLGDSSATVLRLPLNNGGQVRGAAPILFLLFLGCTVAFNGGFQVAGAATMSLYRHILDTIQTRRPIFGVVAGQ